MSLQTSLLTSLVSLHLEKGEVVMVVLMTDGHPLPRNRSNNFGGQDCKDYKEFDHKTW